MISDRYLAALYLLDRLMNHRARHRLLALTALLLGISLAFLGIAYGVGTLPRLALFATGLLPLLLFVWLTVFLCECFYRSLLGRLQEGMFETYQIVRSAEELHGNLLAAFARSRIGYAFLVRAECTNEEIQELLDRSMVAPPEEKVAYLQTLADFVTHLFSSSSLLRELLRRKQLQEADVKRIVAWLREEQSAREVRERWWSREALSTIPAIGKQWNFGHTPILNRSSSDLSRAPLPSYSKTKALLYASELATLETALSKSGDAHVVLVAPPGVGSEELVAALGEKIRQGKTTPELSHKRVLFFHGIALSSGAASREAFESTLLTCMAEAAHAGDVLLVMDNFGALTAAARALGSDMVTLLEPYLETKVQIVVLADPASFRSLLQPQQTFMKHFELLELDELTVEQTQLCMQTLVSSLEQEQTFVMSYPALRRLCESADRYITEGVMPNKASELLLGVVANARQAGDYTITAAVVDRYVQQKTKIPVGKVTSAEKEKLLHVEELLSARVMGQPEAVHAVASAIERLRADIRNPKRPVASFLFLGPTGVGKTETAKALAADYFGSDEALLRLDMTEYQHEDALVRLLGSFAENKVGTLTSLLREHPYGVLLLDEFEKSAAPVKDLFLQILDEGVFSDMGGNKVNARNIIFVATSNAVSDLIFKLQAQQANLDLKKDLITTTIIERGIFKPELINRFDAVIAFHPLGSESLRKIARLQLEKLATRLLAKGITLQVTDDLVNNVVVNGSDAEFGARPMQRYIQDTVEQFIAQKMIISEIQAGDQIVLDWS